MNRKSLALLLILILVVTFIFATGRQLLPGSLLPDAKITQDKPVAMVLLLNKDCDWQMRDRIEHDLIVFTGFKQYQGDFEVHCFNGIWSVNFWQIEKVTAPILRFVYPDRVFLFVYSEQQAKDFAYYMAATYGDKMFNAGLVERMLQGQNLVPGVSMIDKGIGFSDEHYYDQSHELGHLQSCLSWHGDDAEQTVLPVVKVYPTAKNLPWCPQYQPS